VSATAAGVRRWVIKTAVFLAVLAVTLFGSAGTMRWASGWLYLGLVTANQVVVAVLFLKRDPALLAERSGVAAGVKAWDVPLAAMMAIVGPLTMCVISGLDERHNWIGYLEPATIAVAFFVAAAGSTLVTWAMVANRFFAGVARIQSERGQVVVRTGPYAVVRHPGYLGAIAVTFATPYVLGSQWAVFAAYAVVAVIVLRTYLEDRMLLAELPGYREYAAAVRYRLLPGLW
jgi:protein-S-isoprenylcysteine O-methyltransferase Ste14